VTFAHEGHLGRAAVSYLVAYAIGYLLDVAILAIGMHALGQSHIVAQAIAVVVVAVFLYLALKLFVFTPGVVDAPTGARSPLGGDREQRAAER
jgi:hypothetical protein